MLVNCTSSGVLTRIESDTNRRRPEFVMRNQCPLYPRKRTSIRKDGMFAKGLKGTSGRDFKWRRLRPILSTTFVSNFGLLAPAVDVARTSVDQIERFYARNLPLSKEMARNLQSFGGE